MNKFYRKYIKRILDVMISAAGLLLISPVFIITAALVRIKLGSPVIFKQERPGLNEKIFKMYKFRTMNDRRDENGNLLPDEQRLTHFGNLLRSTSLDELPELWNILKGDMSVIGPRPLLVKYLPLYSEKQRHRHDVRPGLTGYAQVYGKYNTTPIDKLKLDLTYIQEYSYRLDLKLLLLTFRIVFRKESSEGVDKNQQTALKDKNEKG